MKKQVAVLLVNGLGDGSIRWRERYMRTYWQKAGVDFHFAAIHWYDDGSFTDKLHQVETRLDALLSEYKKVILLGSSAGGSLALQMYIKHQAEGLWLVIAHGRLCHGRQHWPDYRTLEWAAHLRSERSTRAFYDSVIKCENDVLPNFSKDNHVLNLKPLVDFVVPIGTMSLPGAVERRTISFGHKWAGLSHLLWCRNLILRFADVR